MPVTQNNVASKQPPGLWGEYKLVTLPNFLWQDHPGSVEEDLRWMKAQLDASEAEGDAGIAVPLGTLSRVFLHFSEGADFFGYSGNGEVVIVDTCRPDEEFGCWNWGSSGVVTRSWAVRYVDESMKQIKGE